MIAALVLRGQQRQHGGAVAAEEAMFTEDVFEDEDVEAVAEAEETAEAKSEDKAE